MRCKVPVRRCLEGDVSEDEGGIRRSRVMDSTLATRMASISPAKSPRQVSIAKVETP